MSVAYRLMYRVGFTPWEHREPPVPLADLVDGPAALPPGDMLDIGCGTGLDAIYCARHGWNVTGVDVVPLALKRARRNTDAAGVRVRLIHADISRPAGDLGGKYSLLLDIGCFDGLKDEQRRRAAPTITRLAAPGATMVMFTFAPGGSRMGPHGIEPSRIRDLFPQWDIAFTRPADEVEVGGPMRNTPRFWHQLVKH